MAGHTSKGGLGFGTCYACLNYRPLKYSLGGWSGPWFCRGCICRVNFRVETAQEFADRNRAELASKGWLGRPRP